MTEKRRGAPRRLDHDTIFAQWREGRSYEWIAARHGSTAASIGVLVRRMQRQEADRPPSHGMLVYRPDDPRIWGRHV